MTTNGTDLKEAAARLQQKIAAYPDDPAAQAAKADLEALEAAEDLGENLNKRREGAKRRPGKNERCRPANKQEAPRDLAKGDPEDRLRAARATGTKKA